MPVTVNLIDLVCVPGARGCWPADFAGFVAAMEANPADRTVFGACADWCDEHGEEWLAKAFRFLAKRSEIKLKLRDPERAWKNWVVENVPSAILYANLPEDTPTDNSTIAGVVAELALKIKQAHEELS